jgi:hypothetical protein
MLNAYRRRQPGEWVPLPWGESTVSASGKMDAGKKDACRTLNASRGR